MDEVSQSAFARAPTTMEVRPSRLDFGPPSDPRHDVGMSESGKSAKPVRQLSLQPPAPSRKEIRRQRSAEDDKSLQICAGPLARGKRGTTGKSGFERPKVRVAWTENRRKNEKPAEKVEVVARQIPGRSRPATGRSRGFVGIEKPTILYSRQELAERLRLAWKHREENKANINIFLAHGNLEKRCDSEMSIAALSSPLSKNDLSRYKILVDDHQATRDGTSPISDEDHGGKETDDIAMKNSISRVNGEARIWKQDFQEELSEFEDSCTEEGEVSKRKEDATGEISANHRDRKHGHSSHSFSTQSRSSNVDECPSTSKKRTPACIDCSSSRVPSAALPAIRMDNSASSVRPSKEDPSSAKQKRASFHSGTNRAFLGPVRSPTEFRWNPVAEKPVQKPESRSADGKDAANKAAVQRTASEVKCSSTGEKDSRSQRTASDGKLGSTDRNARAKTVAENKYALFDDKTAAQRTSNGDKVAAIKRIVSSSSVENKGGFAIDMVASARSELEERCNSVIERNPASKKATEAQRCDQKSRRTSSAPPQRHFKSSSNNRVQVNIVIDTLGGRKSDKKRVDCKDNEVEKTHVIKNQVPSGRSVRSAPLKRRSRSAKRRFWSKNDEHGKSRNRSAGRGKASINSKTMDIVTMVSLISSTDSDSDTEISPVDDKLIDELRSKLPTTSIIKTSTNPISIARRPIKSVSFQRDSFDEDPAKEQQPPAKEERKTTTERLAIVNHRGNGGTFSGDDTPPWRTDIPGLALPVLALIRDNVETVDVPLTDREKRCLAVPIGDLHDKKRKLLKTRSVPSRSATEKQITTKTKLQDSLRIVPQKMDAPAQQLRTSVNSPPNMKQVFVTAAKETAQQVQPMPTEPRFQTNKEKECWHLYRKMCDKGVCVSFDTVLRGMLTPTEYRLRQRELLQDL